MINWRSDALNAILPGTRVRGGLGALTMHHRRPVAAAAHDALVATRAEHASAELDKAYAARRSRARGDARDEGVQTRTQRGAHDPGFARARWQRSGYAYRKACHRRLGNKPIT